MAAIASERGRVRQPAGGYSTLSLSMEDAGNPVDEPIVKGGRRRSSQSMQQSQIILNDYDHPPAADLRPTRVHRAIQSSIGTGDVPTMVGGDDQPARAGIRTAYQRPPTTTPFATLQDLQAPLNDEVSPTPAFEAQPPPFATLADLV